MHTSISGRKRILACTCTKVEYHWGQNLADELATPYNPSTLYQEPDTKFNQLLFGQYFWDKQAHVKIGRIAANYQDFDDAPFGWSLASVGYDAALTLSLEMLLTF